MWLVTSEGFYLRSLVKAQAGEGVDGGAFTENVKQARKYKSKAVAQRIARQIYQGRVVNVDDEKAK